MNIVLASGSAARAEMLRAAGVPFTVDVARVDEEAVRAAMAAGGARPREIADALAEAKAKKVSAKHPAALTLGADQILDFDGRALGKCHTRGEAAALLRRMSGQRHILWSAAVIAEAGRPVWRHIGEARMQMRDLSDGYIDAYLDRNWEDVRHAVGCYRIEAEGIRLFDTIGADYHAILGLPLMPLLSYLAVRGVIAT